MLSSGHDMVSDFMNPQKLPVPAQDRARQNSSKDGGTLQSHPYLRISRQLVAAEAGESFFLGGVTTVGFSCSNEQPIPLSILKSLTELSVLLRKMLMGKGMLEVYGES